MKAKKITLATLKAFVRKNKDNLFILRESTFDGMIDGLRYLDKKVKPAELENPELPSSNTLGIKGVWLVKSSRDYFEPVTMDGFEGIRVLNSCGCFSLLKKIRG